MPQSIAAFKNVSYRYPDSDQFALKDIELQINEGEIIGLIGPTGAGKTTFCLTFNGIVPQFFNGNFHGRLDIAGFDSIENPISTLAGIVSLVFEDPDNQLVTTSVENEIAFPLENLKVPRRIIQACIPELLSAVRLEGLEKKHPHELSGGQKQRLAIAAAISVQPQILVLDEPTSQLDPIGREEIFNIIRDLNRNSGTTVVIASHAAEELAQFADRIAVLVEGKIIRFGTSDEVFSDVSFLRKHGLRPPQVSETFFALSEKGFPVERVPVRMSDATDYRSGLANQKPDPDFQLLDPVRTSAKPTI